MENKEMYESLIKWLKILELSGPCGKKNQKQFLLSDSPKKIRNL